jgi:membrane protease YdiL (CAAX protease family)
MGLAGWAFLVFAGALLPLAAAAFTASVRRARDASPAPATTRSQLYVQALFTHVILFGAALIAARAEGVALFTRRPIGLRDVAIALGTLLAVLAIGELSWRARSPEARERLWVRRIVPHTRAERQLWILVSAGAAVAEEVAYRGVFVALAAAATGSVPIAATLSAIAFALVHAPQGLAGVGYVFVIALLHQGLVMATDTLLLAMLVHFAYDVLAGLWLAQRPWRTNADGSKSEGPEC